jgi:hypothetical protein
MKLIQITSLTKWKDGSSLKTKRYRITKWGLNGEFGYELYKYLIDKSQLTNLASDSFS